MSQLAVEYLIADAGLAKSPRDVTSIWLEMAGGPKWPQEGTDFKTAFERQMGNSVEDYEAEFFSLMEQYLPPT